MSMIHPAPNSRSPPLSLAHGPMATADHAG